MRYTAGVRIGWLTDLHLNFLAPWAQAAFYEQIREERLDALLISGDIGDAESVVSILSQFAAVVKVPVYFVLGNHDFYGGSMTGVRREIESLCAASEWLRWLPAVGVVSLTAGTALIGHDSWADGRCGDFERSDVFLNDYRLVEEVTGLLKYQRLAKLNELGDEAAQYLEVQARQALAKHKNVIVLTHVPPFREACWHEGRISDNDYLPHFACRVVGERLAAVMREHPFQGMDVLCGHTHGAGRVQVLDNLSVTTGGAEYGFPKLQSVIQPTG